MFQHVSERVEVTDGVNNRWERVEIALKGIILGEGEASDDPVGAIKARYEKGENDEFLKPIIFNGDAARVKGTHISSLLVQYPLIIFTQITTLSSSSTTALTASAKSPSSSVLTPPHSPPSPSPRTSTSPP